MWPEAPLRSNTARPRASSAACAQKREKKRVRHCSSGGCFLRQAAAAESAFEKAWLHTLASATGDATSAQRPASRQRPSSDRRAAGIMPAGRRRRRREEPQQQWRDHGCGLRAMGANGAGSKGEMKATEWHASGATVVRRSPCELCRRRRERLTVKPSHLGFGGRNRIAGAAISAYKAGKSDPGRAAAAGCVCEEVLSRPRARRSSRTRDEARAPLSCDARARFLRAEYIDPRDE